MNAWKTMIVLSVKLVETKSALTHVLSLSVDRMLSARLNITQEFAIVHLACKATPLLGVLKLVVREMMTAPVQRNVS